MNPIGTRLFFTRHRPMRLASPRRFACIGRVGHVGRFVISQTVRMALIAAGAALLTSAAARAQPAPLPPMADAGQGAVLALVVHDQRVIPARRTERIAVGDPAVADVVPVNDGVLVLAKKPGETLLSIWSDGRATPTVRQIRVRAALSDALLPGTGAQVSVRDGAAVIDGNLPDMAAHQAALAVAQQSGAKVVDNAAVGAGGVVQVDVKVVEFNKSVLKEAGFNLFSSRNNGFGFGVFGSSNLTSFTPTQSNVSFGSTVGTAMSSAFNLVAGPFGAGFFANLSVLESNGLARVLAEPTLVALSGQSASFLAGGELPIPQSGGLGTTTVIYKSYGVGLTVTPTVLSPHRIALKVAPEASELDYTHQLVVSDVSVPAITTRRADTMVELGDGDSFVIGGLVSRSTRAAVDKVPMLGDLPIIGTFFKRLTYSQDDSELVIVVTPHLIAPIARGTPLPMPGDGRDNSDQPVWSAFVGGAMTPVNAELPGFSR